METTDALGSLVIVGLVVSTSAVVTPVRPFPESVLAFLDFFPMIWFTQSRYVVVTTRFQWRIVFYCTRPRVSCSTPLKVCSKWFTKIAALKMRGYFESLNTLVVGRRLAVDT